MIVETQAPSNIALIKYMGKIEGTGNKPTNASLSYTLPHLLTTVRLESLDDGSDVPKIGLAATDEWAPLEKAGFGKPELSTKGREKFLRHFEFLKKELGGRGSFRLLSANNFPSDCGLASSASSFAALTAAAVAAFAPATSLREISKLSRKGSGSSCRSLFRPWALWRDEGAEPIDLGYPDLLHAAVVVSAGVKAVSSSDAHVRVTTSPKFAGRPERAEQRLRELTGALKEKNWKRSYEICRDEFVDMHELFETSAEPFKYRNQASQDVVDACKHIWLHKNDGPIVTMDAGPNVHLLFRPDQRELADKMIDHFRTKHVVMTSWRGMK